MRDMKIVTNYHGEIIINKQHIIHFEQGVPGFEDEKEFVVLPLAIDSPFFVLQSITTTYVAFVMVEVFTLFGDYDIVLNQEVQQSLEAERADDVVAFTILTIQEPFQNTTANLLAPVVINTIKNKGRQLILNGTNYSTRTAIPMKSFVLQGG